MAVEKKRTGGGLTLEDQVFGVVVDDEPTTTSLATTMADPPTSQSGCPLLMATTSGVDVVTRPGCCVT